jgi:hypothetical protein
VSDGYVNTRVVKFDKNGKFLMTWGEKGNPGSETRPNYMNTVHAIAVDKQRRLYVSDRANHRVQVFDENGKFLDMWTNVPLPYSFLMTDDQFLWSASGQTQKFTKYDLNGQLLARGARSVRSPAVLGRASVPRRPPRATSTRPTSTSGVRRSSAQTGRRPEQALRPPQLPV